MNSVHAKIWIKRSVARLLYGSGLLRLLARRRLDRRAVVLMYHRVLPEDEAKRSFSHPGIIVTPETFAQHLDFIRRYLRPLTLAEFEAYMESADGFPSAACLLTFDDGWIDNHRYAMPLLRARGVPAVVFTATDYIGTERAFWQEELGHLLFEAARQGAAPELMDSHGIGRDVVQNEPELRTQVAAVVERYRKASYADIDVLRSGLVDALSRKGIATAVPRRDRFMDWSQVAELEANGITVASHTCSHRILTRLDRESAKRELTGSKAVLQSRLGREICSLAYPNGDHDDAIQIAAQECGYRVAFTTRPGFVRAGVAPMLTPRINVHETATCTTPLFFCRTLGLF